MGCWIVAFAVVFAAVGWLQERRESLPFPGGGETHWFVRIGNLPMAPLALSAPSHPRLRYAVRLDDFATGSPLALILLGPGETSALQVPLGRYRVTIARGTTWLGPERLFGNDSDVRQTNDPLHFYQADGSSHGHHVRLGTGLVGNLETTPAPPSAKKQQSVIVPRPSAVRPVT